MLPDPCSYNYGDGNDTIIDSGNVGVTPDVLELKGIRLDDVIFDKDGDDMIIYIKDGYRGDDTISGSITIESGFANGKIEQYIFDDQSIDFSKALAQIYKDDSYRFYEGIGEVSIYDYGSVEGDRVVYINSSIYNNHPTKESLIVA